MLSLLALLVRVKVLERLLYNWVVDRVLISNGVHHSPTMRFRCIGGKLYWKYVFFMYRICSLCVNIN